MLALKEKPQIKVNLLKQIALDGKKSRDSLIGRKVRFLGSDITKQLITGGIYTIKKVSAGNYDAFIYLEELPERRISEFNGLNVPNCFPIDKFELIE